MGYTFLHISYRCFCAATRSSRNGSVLRHKSTESILVNSSEKAFWSPISLIIFVKWNWTRMSEFHIHSVRLRWLKIRHKYYGSHTLGVYVEPSALTMFPARKHFGFPGLFFSPSPCIVNLLLWNSPPFFIFSSWERYSFAWFQSSSSCFGSQSFFFFLQLLLQDTYKTIPTFCQLYLVLFYYYFKLHMCKR